MAKSFDYYEKLADRLITADNKRNQAFQAYQNMYRGEWDLPGGLPSYTQKVIDQGPHDAIQAGVRVLSSIYPKVTIFPPRDLPDQKVMMNQWEKVLKWHLKAADRRRPVGVVSDTVLSALLYGAVALMVIDLDWQLEQVKAVEADDARIKALRRYSRFVVNNYLPMDVHTLRSSYGTEAVLLCQKRLASEVVAEWGKAAGKLKDIAEEGGAVEYYDLMDYSDRCVWVLPEQGSAVKIVAPVAHNLGFMPWVAMMGGTTLENKEEDKYHPMLYALYKTKTWDAVNVLRSQTFTDELVKMFKKDLAIEGQQVALDEPLELNFEDPSGVMELPAGRTARQLAKQGLDPAKNELIAQFQADISRSTVPAVLQGGEVISGESFAGYGLRVQTAVNALKPGKALAEKALAELYAIMLHWTEKGNKPLTARGMDKRTDLGANYQINPDEIDLANLYIEVELKPDNPTDRIQQANAGMILQQLGYPKEYVLEQVGVEDPQAAMKQYWLEKMKENRIQIIMDHERMMMEQQHQEMAMAAQAQMAQEQEAQALAQQQEMAGPIQGGPGFNPGAGGMPPAMAFPQGTREEVNMMEGFGEATAGMEGL